MRSSRVRQTHVHLISGALVALGLALTPSMAHAELILAPHSTDWEYTFTNPTGDPSWNTTIGVGGVFGWALGQTPFGNQVSGDPDFIANTLWEVEDPVDGTDDLWLRRAVDFSGWDLGTIRWDLGVDNGFKLYANGILVASDNQEGFTARWEYSDGTFGDSNSYLTPGVNYIAVALDDHGGATAFDMQITGTPEPGSLILLGTGLLGAAASLRRRRKASARIATPTERPH